MKVKFSAEKLTSAVSLIFLGFEYCTHKGGSRLTSEEKLLQPSYVKPATPDEVDAAGKKQYGQSSIPRPNELQVHMLAVTFYILYSKWIPYMLQGPFQHQLNMG